MIRRNISLLVLLLAAFGCQQEKVVKIGAVLPLTGEGATYGQPVNKGVELAFEELQARSDLPYPFELDIRDSGSDPAKAAELLEQLYEEGALAVIGGVITPEALQMVTVADRYNQVLISPSATSPELTGISKNFYRVFPSDAREGATMGNFATQKLKAERVVILAKEHEYARGIQQQFSEQFEQFGGEVLELIEFPSVPSDLSGLVERVMTLEPDAVYLAAYAEDLAKMISGLRDLGYKGTIFTTSAFASPEIIEQVGKPAEGVFLTQAAFDTDSEEPKVSAFVSAYREKYGVNPGLYAAHGYDAFNVIAHAAIEKNALPSEFWSSVRSLREFEGATGTIQFDERGDVQKFPRVYVVNNGRLIDYEAEVERRRRALLDRLRELEKRQQSEAPPPPPN
jgi:branched-chain amino acid transport system substrate-binding protein